MSDRFLIELQEDIAARLQADEVFRNLAVITERSGDPVADIEKSVGPLSGKAGFRGLCMVVMQITGNVEFPNEPGPVLDLVVSVRVMENPVLNNTKIEALTAARRISRLLHHYSPGGLASCLIGLNPCIAPVSDPIAPVAYNVRFGTRDAGFVTGDKVLDPIIAFQATTVPAVVTITCGTPGATLLTTTNGSPPYPGNRTAVPYTGPVTIQDACVLRCAAHRSGLMSSNVVAEEFTAP